MKYILFSDLSGSLPETPIVFPNWIEHAGVAARMAPNWQPISAGFVRVVHHSDAERPEVECYGHSDSLGLRSNPKDADFLDDLLQK